MNLLVVPVEKCNFFDFQIDKIVGQSSSYICKYGKTQAEIIRDKTSEDYSDPPCIMHIIISDIPIKVRILENLEQYVTIDERFVIRFNTLN